MTKVTSRLLALLAGAASAIACLSGSVLARQTTKPENGSAPATPAPTPLPAPAALAASAIATAEPVQSQDLAFAQNLSRMYRAHTINRTCHVYSFSGSPRSRLLQDPMPSI